MTNFETATFVWSLEHDGFPCLGYYRSSREDSIFYSALSNAAFRSAPYDCVFVGTIGDFEKYVARNEINTYPALQLVAVAAQTFGKELTALSIDLDRRFH